MAETPATNVVDLAEIRRGIVSAFDRDTFATFMSDRFKVTVTNDVGNYGLNQIVGYYLGRSIQEGWVVEFIQRVAEDRPKRDGLRELAAKYRNTPLAAFTSANAAADGTGTSGGKRNNLPFVSLGTLFKGREGVLIELRASLLRERTTAAAVVASRTLYGLGGIGKTRTAIEYAWTYFAEYRYLFYVVADTPDKLQTNLAALSTSRLLEVIGPEVKEEESHYREVVKWLQANRHWLLILDNVDTPAGTDAVESLLPRLSNGHVLITSRLSEWGGGVEATELGTLDPDPATRFLLERTNGKRKATPTDEADALALAADLGYLALALEQAAAFIATVRTGFASYRERWRKQEDKVIGWENERLTKYPRSVAKTWLTSFEQLTPEGKQLIEILAWLSPEPIPVELTDKVETLDAEFARADLARYSLLRWEADNASFRIHRLVQEMTRYHLGTQGVAFFDLALRMLNGFTVEAPDDVRYWKSIYEPVEPHLSAVIDFGKKVAEGNIELSKSLARLQNQLAFYLTAKCLWNKAEQHYRAAERLYRESVGEDSPDFAGLINNLASLLQATNRHADAEPLMQRVVGIFERSYGQSHPNVATALNNLAFLLQETNRHADAEPLIRRALAIDEKNFGPEHPDVARDLDNLAFLLQATNRHADAEPLTLRALAIDEKSFGPEHPKVAIRLNNLAQLLQETNRHADAEPLMQRVLAIDTASFGPEHPNVARDLSNLASLLQATNRHAEAEPLKRRALAIDEKSFGPEHPNVARDLNNLAQLLQATNRHADAEPLMQRVVSIFEQSYGLSHPNVATALSNLASLLQKTNRHAEAEPLMWRALAIDEKSFGPEHPNVAIRLNNLASLLLETSRHADAEPLFEQAFWIILRFRHRTGHDHPNFEQYLTNFWVLFQTLGLSEEQILDRLKKVAEQAATTS